MKLNKVNSSSYVEADLNPWLADADAKTQDFNYCTLLPPSGWNLVSIQPTSAVEMTYTLGETGLNPSGLSQYLKDM